jgi:hypothetical protein
MMTNFHFEVFAPGMKAKLDPTYRREFEYSRMPAKAEMMSRIARSSHQAFLPFTSTKETLATSGRR